MLKRAWLVFALLWIAVFLGNGATKVDGIRAGDVAIAFAPLVVIWLCRFVIFGLPRPSRRP
jgi:hypothetical protein